MRGEVWDDNVWVESSAWLFNSMYCRLFYGKVCIILESNLGPSITKSCQ